MWQRYQQILPMRRLAAYVIESQAIAHSLEHKPLTHLLKDCPPSKVQITDTAVMASPSRASVCLRFRSTPEMCHAHCMRVGCESQRSEFPTGAVSNKPLPAPKTKPWTRHAVSHIWRHYAFTMKLCLVLEIHSSIGEKFPQDLVILSWHVMKSKAQPHGAGFFVIDSVFLNKSWKRKLSGQGGEKSAL